jgi:hypothetical protein
MTLIGLSTGTVTGCVRFIAVYVYGWFAVQKLNFAYAKNEAYVASLNITVSAKKSSCYA